MFVECAAPSIDLSQYPYFAGDLTCDSKWYRYLDYYMEEECIDGIAWLSIINIGQSANVLTQVVDLCKRSAAKHKYIGITYVEGYKSEILIKRVVRNFRLLDYGKVEDRIYYILENKEALCRE